MELDTQYRSSIVKLNVGGYKYTTTYETLISKDKDKPNFFDTLLSGKIPSLKDEEGAYFIDRDGKIFQKFLSKNNTRFIVIKVNHLGAYSIIYELETCI